MRFVIIAAERTGSSYLTSRLRRHRDILCHGEVFHKKNVWVYWPKRDSTDEVKAELHTLRHKDPRALLERVFAATYGHPCVGFKIFKGQCDSILQTLIDDRSVRKVVLYRRNVLANYASALAAARTGIWSTKEALETEVPKLTFKSAQFIRFHDDYVQSYRFIIGSLNENREPFLLYNYEDVNDPMLFAGLLVFIGADPGRFREIPRREIVKQNPADVLSRFSNPDAAASFLRDHGLLHWAHEPRTDCGPLALIAAPAVQPNV